MEVQALYEYNGGGGPPNGYVARGHVDLDEFRAALQEQHDDPHVDDPRHVWWRFIPAGPDWDEHAGYYADARPGSRGAGRFTWADRQGGEGS